MLNCQCCWRQNVNMPIALRFKLLSIPLVILSVALLSIPLLGLRHNSDFEEILRANQKEALLLTAQSVSAVFKDRSDLFQQNNVEKTKVQTDVTETKIIELTTPIRLNGELDDWQPAIKNSEIFAENHLLIPNPEYRPESLSFRHLAGTQGKYLYLIFDVYDDQLVYRQRNTLRLDRSDHLKIIIDKDNEQRIYIVATFEPGWVTGFYIPDDPDEFAVHERRIHGKWKQTGRGYRLELRIQKELLGEKLTFAIADVDDGETGIVKTLIGTVKIEEGEEPDKPNEDKEILTDILESLDLPNTRVRIIDKNKQFKAEIGDLQSKSNTTYRRSEQSASLPSEIASDEIAAVLNGESTTLYYFDESAAGEVIAALMPIYNEEEVIAAVAVEQTAGIERLSNNPSFKETLFPFIIAFLLSVAGIWLYSYRFSEDS